MVSSSRKVLSKRSDSNKLLNAKKSIPEILNGVAALPSNSPFRNGLLSWLKAERIHKYWPLFSNMNYATVIGLSDDNIDGVLEGMGAQPIPIGARSRILRLTELLRERIVDLSKIDELTPLDDVAAVFHRIVSTPLSYTEPEPNGQFLLQTLQSKFDFLVEVHGSFLFTNCKLRRALHSLFARREVPTVLKNHLEKRKKSCDPILKKGNKTPAPTPKNHSNTSLSQNIGPRAIKAGPKTQNQQNRILKANDVPPAPSSQNPSSVERNTASGASEVSLEPSETLNQQIRILKAGDDKSPATSAQKLPEPGSSQSNKTCSEKSSQQTRILKDAGTLPALSFQKPSNFRHDPTSEASKGCKICSEDRNLLIGSSKPSATEPVFTFVRQQPLIQLPECLPPPGFSLFTSYQPAKCSSQLPTSSSSSSPTTFDNRSGNVYDSSWPQPQHLVQLMKSIKNSYDKTVQPVDVNRTWGGVENQVLFDLAVDQDLVDRRTTTSSLSSHC